MSGLEDGGAGASRNGWEGGSRGEEGGPPLSAQGTTCDLKPRLGDTREGSKQTLGADRGERAQDGSLNITWARPRPSFIHKELHNLLAPSTLLGGGFRPAEPSSCGRETTPEQK